MSGSDGMKKARGMPIESGNSKNLRLSGGVHGLAVGLSENGIQ